MTFIKNFSELNTQKVVCEGSLVSASLIDNRIDDKCIKSKFTHLSRVLKQFFAPILFCLLQHTLNKKQFGRKQNCRAKYRDRKKGHEHIKLFNRRQICLTKNRIFYL